MAFIYTRLKIFVISFTKNVGYLTKEIWTKTFLQQQLNSLRETVNILANKTVLPPPPGKEIRKKKRKKRWNNREKVLERNEKS